MWPGEQKGSGKAVTWQAAGIKAPGGLFSGLVGVVAARREERRGGGCRVTGEGVIKCGE